MDNDEDLSGRPDHARRHLRLGWWELVIWLTLGIVLETMHGFKIGWYLDVSNETRRIMWTLAHAHGTLLGVVNILFSLTVRHAIGPARWQALASSCLIGASLLLPGGFLLGGIVVYGGDPGPGILLVPVGAILLLVALALTAWKITAANGSREEPPAEIPREGAPQKRKPGERGRRE